MKICSNIWNKISNRIMMLTIILKLNGLYLQKFIFILNDICSKIIYLSKNLLNIPYILVFKSEHILVILVDRV